jgi:methyl-accepting chemotaxis protein
MQATARRSIRSVLARAIIWTTGATLAVTLVVVCALEWRLFQNEQETRLNSIGGVIAAYSVTAFEFDDPMAGDEALAALAASGDVIFAVLLRPSGEEFASYGSVPNGLDVRELAATPGSNVSTAFVDWSRPIESGDKQVGSLVIRADTSALIRSIMELIAIVLAIAAIAMVVAWFIAARLRENIVSPLDELARTSEAMSDGDLSAEIEIVRDDEVGVLASAFGTMKNRLRVVVSQVRESALAVHGEATRLGDASEAMFAEARRQEAAASETIESIERMSSSVLEVSTTAESLAETAADSNRAMSEIDAAVEHASHNIERVFESSDSAASSVLQMTAAIRQIAENADHLDGATGKTIDSMGELRDSVSDVADNARRTLESTTQAAESARRGEVAVEASITGMKGIEDSFGGIESIVAELAERSQSIHEVLQVIEGVVEQTNLLALNAAIISSQAGEHGKAFSVVAQEVKSLAERTQHSTREISDSIQLVLRGVEAAVEATAAGAERVRDGAQRSEEAGTALRQIRETAEESSEAVSSIVTATASQGNGIQAVANELDRVKDLVGQVSHATHEQSNASADIQQSVETVRQLAEDLKRSTSEQTRQTRLTTEAVERLVTGVAQIHQSTQGQRTDVTQILESVQVFEEGATETTRRAEEMKTTVDALSERSGGLETEVGHFRL